MTTKKERENELEQAKNWLLQYLKPSDTVYTNLLHVSRSGMYRVIDLFVFRDNQPVRLSWMASKLLEGYSDRWEGCKASGCGMDMGFHLVYNLGYALFPNGFTCVGEGCPSNDHSNKPWPDRDGQIHHSEGGYALKQKWM